jgi:hypothetical protein
MLKYRQNFKMLSPFWRERRYLFAGSLIAIAIVVTVIYLTRPLASSLELTNSLQVPMISFPESSWRTPNTLNVKVLASTPFARFEIHQVKTENGEIINDWLWTDERSHVNILVHLRF